MPSGSTAATPPAAAPRPHGRALLSVLFLTVFIDLIGFGIVIPLLPLYAEQFGAGPVTVTWLVAIFSLMQFVFAPWWGQLSDRIGRRPVLLIGLFGSAASYLLFGLAQSLALLFVARALAGVMGANIGVAQAYIADVTPPEQRARGMGLIGAAFGLGFIFGPALGGLLSRYGMAVPFFAAAALSLANALLAVVRLPEPLSAEARARASGSRPGLRERLRALRQLGGRSRLSRLYTASFLVTLAFAAMEATFSLWSARRWGLTPERIAYLFAFLGTVGVLIQGVGMGRLVRRFGERRLALIGAAALTLGLVGVTLAPSLLLLTAALTLFAFGQGTLLPSLSALISHSAGAAEQGRVLGASQSYSALARVLGPVLGGVAFARVGLDAPYFSGAGLAALALVMLVSLPGARS